VVWFAGFLGLTLAVGYVSWKVGIVLATVFALIMLFDMIRLLFVIVTGIILLFAQAASRQVRTMEPDWVYGHAATVVQILETLICLAYLYVLWRFFF
jgi:hypothetical protein